MANVKFIRDTLYQLEKDYGVPVRLGQINSVLLDRDTGLMDVTKRIYPIRKAIQLPTIMARKFVQDIAYLAANKNFTYGALFDERASIFIISAKQLPKNLEVSLNDFLFVGHKRFTLKKVEDLEHDLGWIFTVHDHEGANPFDDIADKVFSNLGFQQEVLYVLN